MNDPRVHHRALCTSHLVFWTLNVLNPTVLYVIQRVPILLQAVLGSLSSTVIGRPDISNLMKQEPANQLLEATYLSQLGIKVQPVNPVDIEGALEVEMELNNLLLSLRPIRQVTRTILTQSCTLLGGCTVLNMYEYT